MSHFVNDVAFRTSIRVAAISGYEIKMQAMS
jgi:hypothetical protein